MKKKNNERKKAGQIKVVVVGLEGFVDWKNLVVSELAEERETKCLASSLDLLCGCISELPTLKGRPSPASKFRTRNALKGLDLMRRSRPTRQ